MLSPAAVGESENRKPTEKLGGLTIQTESCLRLLIYSFLHNSLKNIYKHQDLSNTVRKLRNNTKINITVQNRCSSLISCSLLSIEDLSK